MRARDHHALRRAVGRIPALGSAGMALMAAGALILMAIITAEALYPADYATGENTISDLGGTEPPDSVVLQPSAAIFDTAMVAAGILVLIGALQLHRGIGRRVVSVPVGLLGVGILGVGVFPGNTGPHPIFALLAFTSGGLAGVLAARVLASPFRYASAALGAVALASLLVAMTLLDWGPVEDLGEGGVERWIAYPVVLWLVAVGGHLTALRPARRPALAPGRRAVAELSPGGGDPTPAAAPAASPRPAGRR